MLPWLIWMRGNRGISKYRAPAAEECLLRRGFEYVFKKALNNDDLN
jgi:hypothetical protein